MDRRNFIAGLGGAAAVASTTSASAIAIGEVPKVVATVDARSGPLKLKLGCQSPPPTDNHFAYLARYGVTNIAARAKTSNGRLWSTVDELLCSPSAPMAQI